MNTLLIKGGTVYPMGEGDQAGPVSADILITDGKITAVGETLTNPEAEVIHADGLLVFPGFIDAHCHMGIFETGNGEDGVDGNEISSPATPELRGIDGMHPLDPEFAHAAAGGVTTVAAGPGSSNPIGGTFAALKTAGSRFDDMILADPVAMKVAFGENPKRSFGSRKLAPSTRMATAAIIRTWLQKAKDYETAKNQAEKKQEHFATDLGLEALGKVLRREIPLKAHAHRADDILTALRIAKEFQVEITLEHCSEGHLIPDQLSSARGIVLGPLLGFPQKIENRNQQAAAAQILYEHGLRIAVMSDLPASHASEITRAAGECVKYGLPLTEALRTITANAAEILGLQNRIGRIAPTLDGDITIYDTNPLENLQARCLLTVINGKVVHRDGRFQTTSPAE